MTALTKEQVAAINAAVDAATPDIEQFVQDTAGFFAPPIEASLNSAAGKQAIVKAIKDALAAAAAVHAKAAAAAGKATT